MERERERVSVDVTKLYASFEAKRNRGKLIEVGLNIAR